MKRVNPKEQFSKWLARYGAIVWGVYLLIVAVLIYTQPEAAMACVYLVLIVTANKMLDTWAYTRNSTYEKGLLAMLDKTKMELTLKSGGGISTGSDASDSEDEGEGGNG